MGWGTSHTSRESILDVTAQAGNVTVDNVLQVSNTNYAYEISRGKIIGARAYAKMGYNGDVGTSEEDMWNQGGKYTFPTGATAMEVVSSSGNDTALGTGIRSVRITYLDTAFIEKSEIVTLNGAGAVAMVGRPYRVNAIRAYTVGGNAVAAGTISVQGSGGGTIYRQISQGQTRGRAAIYTVPASKKLFITSVNLSGWNNTANKYLVYTFRANYDDQLDAKASFFEPYFELLCTNMVVHLEFEVPIRVPATCDWVMSCVASQASSIGSVAVRGWQEDV